MFDMFDMFQKEIIELLLRNQGRALLPLPANFQNSNPTDQTLIRLLGKKKRKEKKKTRTTPHFSQPNANSTLKCLLPNPHISNCQNPFYVFMICLNFTNNMISPLLLDI